MAMDSAVDDSTAVQFNAYMRRYPELYRAMAQCVQRYVRGPQPVILDVGMGSGLLSLELRRLYPEGTLLGLDPSRSMLRLAEQNFTEAGLSSLGLLQGVSEALPVCSDWLDAVVSRFSLPYWPDPAKSFQEIFRVLKPGGYLVLEALNKEYPAWRLAVLRVLMRLRAAPRNVITYHIDAYRLAHTREWVEELCQRSGFRLLEAKGRPKDWKFLVVAQKP